MALGLPVVSTNVGGMAYLVNNEEDGLLVKPDNPETMTLAILKLYNNPEMASKIATKARTKVEHFDWQIVKHKWFEILN